MSYHIVNIDDPKVCISCRQGQLCCTDSSGNVRSLPMEDVASVVITSFSPVLHGEFLSRAAEFGIAVILCKNFQPVSILMPANRSSDTLLTKAFVCLDERRSENLWQKTVDAKCANQLFAATLFWRFKKAFDCKYNEMCRKGKRLRPLLLAVVRCGGRR